jgi:hypothetical protein
MGRAVGSLFLSLFCPIFEARSPPTKVRARFNLRNVNRKTWRCAGTDEGKKLTPRSSFSFSLSFVQLSPFLRAEIESKNE